MRAAVITVSTSKAGGDGEDVSGPKLRDLLERAGCEVVAVELIPDERELIAGRLRFYADEEGCDLIATTGGTGLSRDDVTPEATRDVIDREAPGIAEAMRLASREHVPDHWFLSRGVAGTRDRALIVNFPGNPNAIEQAGAAITPSLGHALGLVSGRSRSVEEHLQQDQ
jgi:molybdenum cofactor synthesis domain-containing protein